VTCLQLWDNPRKRGLILDRTPGCMLGGGKPFGVAGDGLAAYQLDGGVMAYLGGDG
jgi:hypothetical protein